MNAKQIKQINEAKQSLGRLRAYFQQYSQWLSKRPVWNGTTSDFDEMLFGHVLRNIDFTAKQQDAEVRKSLETIGQEEAKVVAAQEQNFKQSIANAKEPNRHPKFEL